MGMDGTGVPAPVIAGAVAAARGMLRLEGHGEDAVLTGLVRTALETAEIWCGQAMVARPCVEVLTGTGGWQTLPDHPVTAITELAGVPLAQQAIDIGADGRGRVMLPAGATATVRYVAGAAARWGAVPGPVAHGVVMLAVHLWERRGGDTAPPTAVAALWRPYRRLGIGA
jgi:uncharacterized phiE125 gp8 family phage protein